MAIDIKKPSTWPEGATVRFKPRIFVKTDDSGSTVLLRRSEGNNVWQFPDDIESVEAPKYEPKIGDKIVWGNAHDRFYTVRGICKEVNEIWLKPELGGSKVYYLSDITDCRPYVEPEKPDIAAAQKIYAESVAQVEATSPKPVTPRRAKRKAAKPKRPARKKVAK